MKEIGGLSGAISSLITGKLQGLEDNEIVDSIFTGQRLGKNAVENNLVLHVVRDLDSKEIKSIKDLSGTIITSVGNHSFIVMTPDNPEDFTKEKLIENGLNPDDFKFVSLGDGKLSIVSGGYHKEGSLIAEFNNKTDIKALRDYYTNGKSTSYSSNNIFWDFDVETKEIKSTRLV